MVKDEWSANQQILEFISSMPDWAVRAKVGSHEFSLQALDLKRKRQGNLERLYSKTKETEIYIFAKAIGDRNKEKNKVGTPSEKERGMGKRLNIMNAILLVIGCFIIIFCNVVEV